MSDFAFKYHPEPLKTGSFMDYKTVVCECCGKETGVYHTCPFYTAADVNYLCPECIASGAAAKKFDGAFAAPYAADGVSDPEKVDELIHRTPAFHAWQEPMWLAHCDDFCAFLGCKTWDEIESAGLAADIEENYDDSDFSFDFAKEHS